MQALRLPAHSRGVHVAQHSSQVTVDVLDLFKSRPAQHGLYKRVLHPFLRRLAKLVDQSQRPLEQTFVPLGEQLLSFLFWSICRSALIQHLVSGLSGLVPLGLLDWTRFLFSLVFATHRLLDAK